MKWIDDWQENGEAKSILAREIHGARSMSFNSISGVPQYKTKLLIRWSKITEAICRLLGRPEIWPLSELPSNPEEPETNLAAPGLRNIVCIGAEVSNDQSDYGTDQHGQIIDYNDYGIVDVTYVPRPGAYVRMNQTDDDELAGAYIEEYYFDDVEEPIYHDIPQDPREFVWGNENDEDAPNEPIPLASAAVPAIPDPGISLIHVIEGWCGGDLTLEKFLGTTNDVAYINKNTSRIYNVGTLMLRTYSLQWGYTFRSYRKKNELDPGLGFFDPNGSATGILKLTYEYKERGWTKFFRNASKDHKSGYYVMKYANGTLDNTNVYKPFKPPEAPLTHAIFLSGDFLNLSHSTT